MSTIPSVFGAICPLRGVATVFHAELLQLVVD
jgi:hypothetical protein